MKKLILLVGLLSVFGYVHAMKLALDRTTQEKLPLSQSLQKDRIESHQSILCASLPDNCCGLSVSLEKEQKNPTVKCPLLAVGGIFILGALLGVISARTSSIPFGIAAGAVEILGVVTGLSHLNVTCDVGCRARRVQLCDVVENIQDETVVDVPE